MTSTWVESEFTTNNFSDRRIFARFQTLMSSFAKTLHGTIPKICEKKSEIKAAYRFFSNENVTVEPIQKAHMESVKKRIPENKIILNLQDTTTLRFFTHKSKKDSGDISYGHRGKKSRGYWLHAGLACDTSGTPLGVTSQRVWARKKINAGETRNERKVRLRQTPFLEKESAKWVRACDDSKPLLETGCEVIQVADREADIYEFMQECKKNKFSFLIRTKSNRAVLFSSSNGCKHKCQMVERINKGSHVFSNSTVQITGNNMRKPKSIKVTMQAANATLLTPISNRRSDEGKSLLPIDVTLISVTSKDRVNGKPISWKLLTDRKVQTEKELREIVLWYKVRWQIELFFKTLKTGCQIEASRLTDLRKLKPFLIMKSITAYRVLSLTNYAKSSPNESVFEVITKEEWSILKHVLYKKSHMPRRPKISELIQKIAEIGGFISGRNRFPGIITVWRGWEQIWGSIMVLNRIGVNQLSLVGNR